MWCQLPLLRQPRLGRRYPWQGLRGGCGSTMIRNQTGLEDDAWLALYGAPLVWPSNQRSTERIDTSTSQCQA